MKACGENDKEILEKLTKFGFKTNDGVNGGGVLFSVGIPNELLNCDESVILVSHTWRWSLYVSTFARRFIL